MRTLNLLIVLVLLASNLHGQVGIGTTDPHSSAALDVNGKLRIQDLERGTDGAAKDSLLVIDGRGIIYRIPTSDLLANMDKSLVKSYLSSSSPLLSLSLGSSETSLIFDNENFDVKNEYNPSTGEFTALTSGIFRINLNVKYSILLGGFKIRVYKNSSLILEESGSSSNNSKLSTLVELNASDVISFKLIRTIVTTSISLSSGEENSFFTIEQVR